MDQAKNLLEQQKFYDKYWAEFNYAGAFKLRRTAAILDGLSKSNLKTPHILDTGCGTGWLTAVLGLFGPAVGLDISEGAIRTARYRYPHAKFFVGSVLELPFADASFDVVVSHEVIEHVDEQRHYLYQIQRVLRPAGYLNLTTPNARTFYSMPEGQWRQRATQPIENWLTILSLKQMVSEYFDIIETQTVIFGAGSKGFYRVFNSRRLARYMASWGLLPFWNYLRSRLGFGLHTYILAQKKV